MFMIEIYSMLIYRQIFENMKNCLISNDFAIKSIISDSIEPRYRVVKGRLPLPDVRGDQVVLSEETVRPGRGRVCWRRDGHTGATGRCHRAGGFL